MPANTTWRGATRGETSVRSRGYTGTAHHHYGLPPPGQQHGGADPPHAEGSPVHPRGGRCLKESPAQGLAGHAGCSQGGVRYVGHRGSPTAAAGGAWSATVTQWAASWRGETSGTAGGHTAHRALLRPGGDFITPRWDGPGLRGKRGSSQAKVREVQQPLQGAGEGQQGIEDPGGREGGNHQQGPLEASPGQRGPQGRCAAQAREAKDGLCGFRFCGSKARGACVTEPGLKSPGKCV